MIPKSVTEAAKDGTERELWAAMRDRVAESVESKATAPRDLAALTKRLGEIVREIKQIDARLAKEGRTGGRAADESFDASAV
ncbi:hypothetical protein [Geodermatophilus sp. DSM 45219]|uniref:hypothetical protein n=1 Tax=Geodermatophilus sp. DSM 45219 TaxID=1881103 RepID=UPI001C40B69C|nr:hypothetical protein [Geodermatophilus sp. DSM 45219]